MYYYDIIYKLNEKWMYMYIISENFYEDGNNIPFIKDKLYPKSWTDIRVYLVNRERRRFMQWRKMNRT